MITPLFKLDQNEIFIFISIKVKYVKISEVDFHIDKNNFKFYLKPYFLNLTFSDNLNSESENNSSTYDVDKNLLECKIEKEIAGTEFKDLELISTLFNNKNSGSSIVQRKVEEISTNNLTETELNNCNVNFSNVSEPFFSTITDKDSLNNYLIEFMTNEKISNLNIVNISPSQTKSQSHSYGFNNEFYDVFVNRIEELLEISDLDPSKVEVDKRFFNKMETENEDFCPERYFYDIECEKEDDMFKTALEISLEKYFAKYLEKDSFNFNEKELNTLMTINKTKLNLMDSDNNLYFHFYLQCFDILFAFLYDLRVTELEHNSESGWVINKLSSVLSNFVDFKNLFYSFSHVPPYDFFEEAIKNLLVSSYRRILCYPLYRNLKICEKIKSDLVQLFKNEKCVFFILKFFLRIRNIFEASEPRHILNKIYIDSYIQWVQFFSKNQIWNIISQTIKNVNISKNDLKFDLEDVEQEFINN